MTEFDSAVVGIHVGSARARRRPVITHALFAPVTSHAVTHPRQLRVKGDLKDYISNNCGMTVIWKYGT